MTKTRKQKIIEDYAHDYRDMKMSENDLADLLEATINAYECNHQCTSSCRREGCNCNCGKYHL